MHSICELGCTRMHPASSDRISVATLPVTPLRSQHPPPTSPPQFCLRLTREAGVTLIPVSAFYKDRATAPRTLVRFVFCKTDDKLRAAVEKLLEYFGRD